MYIILMHKVCFYTNSYFISSLNILTIEVSMINVCYSELIRLKIMEIITKI